MRLNAWKMNPISRLRMRARSESLRPVTGLPFKGKVLARYARERSPLASGYLAGPEAIEGKAAALEAEYGKGHVILLGFKPQWRGQSHAAYKFFFNAFYGDG